MIFCEPGGIATIYLRCVALLYVYNSIQQFAQALSNVAPYKTKKETQNKMSTQKW